MKDVADGGGLTLSAWRHNVEPMDMKLELIMVPVTDVDVAARLVGRRQHLILERVRGMP